MKKAVIVVITLAFNMLAASCVPFTVYQLKLSSVERSGKSRPIKTSITNDSLNFIDDNMSISWSSGQSQLDFVLENRTDQTMRIPWDEVVYVDESGVSNRVMHAGVKFINRDQSMPPSILVKGGKLDDTIIPSSNVYYESGRYGGWRQSALFTAASVGKQIRVLMPMVIGEKKHEYLFTFLIGPIVQTQ